VLILVLWVVVILSTIVMNFAFLVRTHVRIASNYSNDTRLYNIASAGVEMAVAVVKNDLDPQDYLTEQWGDSEEFKDVEIGSGRFSLVKNPLEGEEEILYGIEDEASKVNLHTATKETLMALPDMTEDLADALLDWQDTDDRTRPKGAETDYYATLPDPYPCKDAALDSLGELLMVSGFDASVLYGEDWNRNGMLDPGEDDGEETLPLDNQDGILDRGLLPFVTIYSGDKNVNLDDRKRVNIKEAEEKQLKEVIPNLTDKEAKAIVEYRKKNQFEHIGDLLNVTEPSEEKKKDENEKEGTKKGNQSGNKKKESDSSKNKNSKNAKTKRNQEKSTSDSGKGKEKQSQQSKKSEKKVFTQARVKEIIDHCTIAKDDTIEGRININTAPVEVLKTLKGITEKMANEIAAFREQREKGFSNIAELLDVKGMKEDTFIEISDLLTVRSFQFRVNSVATIEGVKTPKTIIAVIDKSGDETTILSWQEK